MPSRIKTDASENIQAVLPADLDVSSPTGISALVGGYTGFDAGLGTIALHADSQTLSLIGNSPDLSLMFGNEAESITIGITTKAQDAEPQDLNLQPQYPFATATGVNRKPGNIVFNLGAPTNSGTKHGEVSMMWGGSERLNVSWDGSDTATIGTSTNLSVESTTKVNINTTTGDVVIGNSNGSITTATWQTNTLTSSKYNITTHSETGYSGTEDKNRFWYGTSSAVGPTILSGSFTPEITYAPSNSLIRIVTEVLGCDATGANSIGVTVVATYKKVSGTLSLVTSTEVNKNQTGSTGTAAAHTAVSGEIRLSVTGIAATNIRWEAYSRVYYGSGY